MIALESLIEREKYEILIGKYPEQVATGERLHHVQLTAKQYRERGPLIGRNKTPVFSRWPMRDKWERFLPAWTYVAYAGNNEMIGRLYQPPIIRLVYLQVPSGEIVQLAYELCGEIYD